MTKIVSRIALLISGILLSSSPAIAQSGDFDILKMGIGYGNFETAALGNFAPALGSIPGADQFTLSLDFATTKNEWLLNYTIGSILGPTISSNGLKMERSGTNIGLGAGYLLLNKPKSKIYPILNVGATVYSTSISEVQNLSLSQIQGDFGRELNLYQLNFMLDLAVHYDYYFNWKTNKKSGLEESFLLGLKAGYLYSFANDNWAYQGGEIDNAPEFGLQGWYLQLTLGMGALKKAKKAP